MAAASCPFCASEVPVELVRDGGTCPKCLAEIPGDEAPTDPGVEVRRKQESRDRLLARIPLAIAFVLLVGLVSCTGVVALGVVLWPDPEVAELLDFDTMDFPMPEVVSADPTPPTPPPEPTKSKTKGGKNPAPEPRNPQPGGIATAPSPTQPDPSSPSASPRPTPPPSSGISIGGPRVRRDDGRVLSDPEEIRNMIGERLAEQIPMLQICYERRLKVQESLSGRWSVTFTVQKDGSAASTVAKGLNRADAELEGCIQSTVNEKWRFSKITIPQPVKRTVTFSH